MRFIQLFQRGINVYRNQGLNTLANKSYHQFGIHEKYESSLFIYSRFRTKFRQTLNQQKWDSFTDPNETIFINPQKIDKLCRYPDITNGLGQVKKGDWEKESEHLEDHWIYEGLHQRFEEGDDWDDTTYFKKGIEQYCNENKIQGYSSPKIFRRQQCAFLDRLYQKLSQEGFELENSEALMKFEIKYNLRNLSYSYPNAILVCIGSGGEIYLRDQLHLFSIARLADLTRIPVKISLRHQEWQSKREQILKESYNERKKVPSQDHPDI